MDITEAAFTFTRIFKHVVGKAPRAPGIYHRTNRLVADSAIWGSTARGIVTSQKFIGRKIDLIIFCFHYVQII
jgi:hypothetical protein